MNITGKLTSEQVTAEVISLDQTFFPTPWTTQAWKDLDLSTHLLVGWREKNALVGFALFGTAPGDDTAHLLKILLLNNSRGTGTSLSFWASILEDLRSRGFKSVYLEVESSNERAKGFYTKVGFKLLRVARAFYSSGEDALIMNLTL